MTYKLLFYLFGGEGGHTLTLIWNNSGSLHRILSKSIGEPLQYTCDQEYMYTRILS